MFRYKKGVKIFGIRPEIQEALRVAESVYAHHGLDCVCTSVTEGKHSKGSRHYLGQAVDIRTKHVQGTDTLKVIVQTIRRNLTDEYDVVLEPTHLHIELDVKR